MSGWIALAPALVGTIILAVMVFSQRRQLHRPSPSLGTPLPPVSILKPLRGLDPNLEENLRSFFSLDYPEYEVILGAQDPADPALAVARKVAAAFPDVPSVVLADSREIGLNPKVNNLANIFRFARHNVLLISDSNVRVPPDYLADLVAHLQQEGVALVSSPIRGISGGRLGSAMESLHLNTVVMGAVAAAHQVAKTVCVVGKSMLLRRETLAAIGGWAFLSRFLAEDQVCGEEIHRQGGILVLSSKPVDNVLGRAPLATFVARHLRWARIRLRMNPMAYLGEILLQPTALAALAAALTPSAFTALAFVGVWGAASLLNLAAERWVGVRRHPALYPVLVLAKDVLLLALWMVPLFTRSVRWRGNHLRLGPRTLLISDQAAAEETVPIAAGA